MSKGKSQADGEPATNGQIDAATDGPPEYVYERRPSRGRESYLVTPEDDAEPVVSVVMPTLNEEEGIGECIDRIEAALEDLEVTGEIIVSDSSDDRTPEIARERGARVVEPDEAGYGAAYQYGFDHVRGEIVAMGDADTTYDFGELPKLFELVASGEADMAMGSRLDGEIKPGAMPSLHQYVGNPLLTRFLNAFYDAGVSDAHSGMRVMTAEALEEMRLGTTGMEFASEMIMEAGARDLEIAEEPITYHEREGDATLDSFEDGWRHVRFMLVNAPGYLFSVPGAVLGALGVLVMAFALFDVQFGATSFGVHSMIAASMLTIAAFQVVSLGIFSTIAGDPIRKPTDPATTWITENLTLESGVTAGVVVFTLGAGYATFLVTRWAASGFTRVPLVMNDIVAFTAITLGMQMVFSSFFLSTIADDD